jgi:P-type conjugative transfer protein TrbJ
MPVSRFSIRKPVLAGALGVTVIAAAIVPMVPAQAQFTVFDPSNYSQNLLTAARTLQQINNQIRSLQNETQSLLNQAKNLSKISFPEWQAITDSLRQVDQLMGEARGIQFKTANVDQQFRQLFPQSFSQALSNDQHVIEAHGRLDTSMAALRQTIGVQAQIVENIASDSATLGGIIARSQGAEGALQAQQATNQLLALVAKQQFQLQNLMAAQYRADAIERARNLQSQSDARAATQKFLGSGSAYTPQ